MGQHSEESRFFLAECFEYSLFCPVSSVNTPDCVVWVWERAVQCENEGEAEYNEGALKKPRETLNKEFDCC